MDDLTALPANLPTPLDDGEANHLPGMPLPAMILTDTSGTSVNLGALLAGRTILYIYPMTGRPGIAQPPGWDDIPGARGCTAESCGFRDHFTDLMAAGASSVFGLSRQDFEYQREAVERLRLPFQLLSDPGGLLGDALGLPTFNVGDLVLYRRLTLIIRDGIVEKSFYPVFPPDRHASEVLTWLRASPAER